MANLEDFETQELTLERRLYALYRVIYQMGGDIETLTEACYRLNERLAVTEKALADILADRRES